VTSPSLVYRYRRSGECITVIFGAEIRRCLKFKTEAVGSSETSIKIYGTAQRRIPEDSYLLTCLYFAEELYKNPQHISLINCTERHLERFARLLCWRAGRPEFDSRQVQEIFLSTPQRPDRLWCSPSLLYNCYRGLFPWGKAAGAWNWPLNSV
jgi:hypothetical protein